MVEREWRGEAVEIVDLTVGASAGVQRRERRYQHAALRDWPRDRTTCFRCWRSWGWSDRTRLPFEDVPRPQAQMLGRCARLRGALVRVSTWQPISAR
jgi:hypothetical protein